MSKVFIEESTLTAIGDAIREKEGSAELIPTAEMAQRIGALSGGGGVDFSQWGEIRLVTLNCFDNSEATINLPLAQSLEKLCFREKDTSGEWKNTTVEHLTINCPNHVGSIAYMLTANATVREGKLKHLTMNVDTSMATTALNAFYACNELEIIDGTPLDFSGMTSNSHMTNAFHMCYKLAEVRFKGQINVSVAMVKLQQISKATINSVVACLADDATGKSISFNEKRINALYKTSEGAADGASSAEWAAIVATKPNWTFSLGA